MKKEIINICGESLFNYNPYWLKTYGELLIFMSKVDMKETISLIDFPDDEDEGEYEKYAEGQSVFRKLYEKYGFYAEGYALRDLSDWFIWYCKEYHKAHKETSIKAKQEKIEQLKRELEELENTLPTK